MKKIVVFVILILLVTISYGGPSKKSFPETQPNIQDNGKNLVWIDTNDLTKSMVLIQKWIDEHPTKKITAISSDSTLGYGRQKGWLIVYEDR